MQSIKRLNNSLLTLQSNIDTLSSSTDNKLDAEKNAREEADAALTNALNSEIERATSAETTLTNSLNSEVKRASDAEAKLSSTIASNYTTLSTAIDDEKKRAEAQESALNAKIESLGESLGNTNSATVASGEYSSTDKAIYLKNISGETLSTIDATAFIKDGMVTSASVVGENLVITFNTDAGHEDILIPISDIFNANNYYTKTEIDTKVDDINSQLSEYGQTTSQALNDLGARLSGETRAREAADTTLQNNINALSGDTDTKIANEASARTSADTTLQSNIDALSGITDTKIANETTARQEADTTLQTNIDNVNSGLTAHTANTVVHVTQEDKDKWNTPTDLSNYYTKTEVDEAIANVDVTGQLQNYYTKSEVDEKDAAINATIEAYGQVTSQALNDLGTRLDDYGKVTSQSLNDLSAKFGDYYTKTEVDTAIANVDVTGQLQNYYTKSEVDSKDTTIQTAINALSGDTKTKIDSEIAARVSGDNALQTALDALDAHVSENEDIVSQSLNDLNNRIAELEAKLLNLENNGLVAG